MRRLLRWCFNGLCLLSLAACLGAGWLWWHSYRGRGHRLSARLRGERYGLRSEAGRVALLRLPSAEGARGAEARDWIGRTRNADLRWAVNVSAFDDPQRSDADPEIEWPLLRLGLATGTPAGSFRPLLDGLEDPERFAAAHAALTKCVRVSNGLHRGGVYRDFGRRRITAVYNGLRFDVPPAGKGWDADPFIQAIYKGPAPAGYDAAQMPAIRDFWFGAMARPIASSRDWPFVAAPLMPPLLWLALRSRRLCVRGRRRRRGLCLRCGYDLTGNTSGRCSECGEPVNAGATA